MTIKMIFDMIGSGVNYHERHFLFDGWVDGKLDKNNPNAYVEYELFLAQPVLDWCEENNITDFTTESHRYAMQIIFIFNQLEDAMAFKLRWFHKRCKML